MLLRFTNLPTIYELMVLIDFRITDLILVNSMIYVYLNNDTTKQYCMCTLQQIIISMLVVAFSTPRPRGGYVHVQ